MSQPIAPKALHGLILKALANDGTELAIVDVREEQAFADNHLLYAIGTGKIEQFWMSFSKHF